MRGGTLATQKPISDDRLVEQALQVGDGDLRPFDILVERHRGRVLANCRFLTRSDSDVEDLAQEVFVKAFFGLPRFKGRSSFATWLQRIKINHCLNYNEKASRRKTIDIDGPGVGARHELQVEPRAEEQVQADSERQRIVRTLESLSDSLRIPLVLRDVDGASYQEIADHLGVGLSAVKMRIKRAREAFRSEWRARFGEYTAP